MLILYFFAMYSNLILSTIRTLRLINDLIIIMIFIYFCIEEDKLNFFFLMGFGPFQQEEVDKFRISSLY